MLNHVRGSEIPLGSYSKVPIIFFDEGGKLSVCEIINMSEEYIDLILSGKLYSDFLDGIKNGSRVEIQPSQIVGTTTYLNGFST